MEQGVSSRLSRRQVVAASAASAVAGLGPDLALGRTPFAQGSNDAALRELLAQSARADAGLDPTTARRRGDPAARGFVDPLSNGYGEGLLAARRADMAGLDGIDRARLSAVDRIAYDTLRFQAADVLANFDDGVFEIDRMTPLAPSDGLQVAFPDFIAGGGAPFRTREDYADGLAQLGAFAGYLHAAVGRLEEGRARGYLQPRIVVQNTLAEVDVMLASPPEATPFYQPLKAQPPTLSPADFARFQGAYLQVISHEVLPGYQLWKTYLSQTYLPAAREAPGLWAMKDGAKVYAAALRHHTTTDLQADAIHQLGLSEVARIRAEMEAVHTRIGYPGDLHAFFAHVRTDPSFYYTQPQDLLARFKAIEARIWDAMPRLFDRRPKAAWEVRPLPTLGAARGTGYNQLGPADGHSPGVLYFNMSMLSTRPIPTLETLTLHEGIPGHHYQGSLAQENTALPDILRFGQDEFTAYAEGWALYAESLGPELGLFTDPYQWFGHLDFEMLRAVRLVVDTGIHAQGWSRERAIAYMSANTSMAAKDVAVEIDRYIAVPAQATAYKVGELKIAELRSRARRQLGRGFDIRRFHDQVLMTGALPLGVLEAKIDGWIADGGPAYSPS
jgi:uncharacterized protein (DUF885 family)